MYSVTNYKTIWPVVAYLSLLAFLSLNPWLLPDPHQAIGMITWDLLDHAAAYGFLAFLLLSALKVQHENCLQPYWQSCYRVYSVLCLSWGNYGLHRHAIFLFSMHMPMSLDHAWAWLPSGVFTWHCRCFDLIENGYFETRHWIGKASGQTFVLLRDRNRWPLAV